MNGSGIVAAISLFLATLVLEDAAAIGAGLLIAGGLISWPAAFIACFLGIWSGDAGLYALARCGGRRWFERSRFERYSDRVARSETWFAKRGTSILIFSRMLPGARLPTYLAAGFLRLPLSRFLLVTGAASFVWTLVVLWLSHSLGARLSVSFVAYRRTGMLLLVTGLLAYLGSKSVPRLLNVGVFSRSGLGRWDTATFVKRMPVFFARLCHWEFWPAWMFYPPVGVYCLWLAIKHRSLMLPTAANPGIFSGGIVGESKMATLRALMFTNPEFTAEAQLIPGNTLLDRLKSLQEIRERLHLSFPFILKPDVGQRGAGVKIIRSPQQAEAYLKQTSAPLLAQRYAPGPHEVGVFYYRLPHESRGHIFAITEKIFPVITGDGHSTIAELIWNDERARFMAKKYLGRLKGREDEILPAGEALKLVEAGNHAEGCIFRDGMHLLTPALSERIDSISQKLSGFFIGRYDIRFSSVEDLKKGQDFQIVELNGAASEATSIYDARNSLLTAYKTLFRQWDLVFAIGAANREQGATATPARLLWRKWREYVQMAATYPAAD
jgi:membrane protein DedA with SNARE-associated domain